MLKKMLYPPSHEVEARKRQQKGPKTATVQSAWTCSRPLELCAYTLEPDYEMYKIQRDGSRERERDKEKRNEKKREKNANIDEEDEKAKVTVVPIEDEEDRRLGRKKRTQEDMVADFVKILEQMMNPRQAITSFISAATGLAAITIGSIYINRLPETALKAKKLVIILIVYGVLQVLLATAFFVTCMQTSIAVSKGVKDAFQIVVGLMVALIYVGISLIAMVVGIYGFYKSLALLSYVEYADTTSLTYCPQIVFYTSLVVFVLHIILIISKCCCCK
ncbi:unnamed protein product [Cylicocyclus nassatus]|uniref:Uncharacterized protein n=1 Tax=Cylicocyclus nassatus TaxID=53992 RepID=A0AA36M3Y9_CYLNA|nr:unnamed protein product [Cylicocyclus nassatus]